MRSREKQLLDEMASLRSSMPTAVPEVAASTTQAKATKATRPMKGARETQANLRQRPTKALKTEAKKLCLLNKTPSTTKPLPSPLWPLPSHYQAPFGHYQATTKPPLATTNPNGKEGAG